MKKLKKFYPYLYCLLIAFLFLMVCSKNSFLYELNDWVDANAFFTVGKGMVRGTVPYLDLFEQKGPLLYLIYGIGSFISYHSFFGVFLLEVVSFSIFLYYAYQIICLFYEKEKAYFALPIFTLCVVTLKSFSHGGSAEEFVLPFFMISLYYLIRYLREKETISIPKYQVFICGVCAGCALWIKYTLLGFWFGWMICIFLLLLFRKQYKEAFFNCFLFLGGMLVATIPWLIYFGYHGGFRDLIDVYFLVNMNAYPHEASFLIKLSQTIHLLLLNLFGNCIMYLFIILGIVLFSVSKKSWGKKGSNLILMITVICTGLFAYIGGTNFHYYSFILSPFILIGFLSFLKIFGSNINCSKMCLISFLTCCLISAYYASNNTVMMKWKPDDYAQYQFAKIINQDSENTVLNYGFLDGGFYLTTGQIPEYYYFMKNNIPYENYPEMINEQKKYIRMQEPKYVVARNSEAMKTDEINRHYRIITKHSQMYQSKKVEYLLYQRIG